jgi:hypothetical protein
MDRIGRIGEVDTSARGLRDLGGLSFSVEVGALHFYSILSILSILFLSHSRLFASIRG